MGQKPNFVYESRIVAFLDIVGFSALVAATKDDSQKENDLIQTMRSVHRYFDALSGESFRVTVFSDSIVISVNRDVSVGDFFVAMAKYLFYSMKETGLVIRGAITQGKIFHENSVILGPAMVRAYELESRSAIYPRVILDPEVAFDLSGQARIFKVVERDFDGLDFINFFSRRILEYDKPVRSTPDEDFAVLVARARKANPPRNTEQRIKHSWLVSYADTQKSLNEGEKDALGE